MARNPRTPRDPRPGDFDAELEALGPRDVKRHPGNPNAKLTVVCGYERGADGRVARWRLGKEEAPGRLRRR